MQIQDDPARRNEELFDSLADTYDEVGVDFFGPIAEGLVEELAVSEGEAVLDMGCGKGALTLSAARLAGSGGRVLGVDASTAMLESLVSAAATASLHNVEVNQGDVQDPAWIDGHFDVVASSLVLFFLAEPGLALQRWRELLRPGGRVGVSTFGRQDDTWRHVDEVFTPYLPQKMLDARVSGSKGPFSTDEGVEDLVRAAGYSDVMTRSIDLQVRFRDADHWRSFTMSTGQRAMWAAVPPTEHDDVRREAERRLEPARQPEGGYLVSQRVRYTLGRN